jgi:hypothetical protein
VRQRLGRVRAQSGCFAATLRGKTLSLAWLGRKMFYRDALEAINRLARAPM